MKPAASPRRRTSFRRGAARVVRALCVLCAPIVAIPACLTLAGCGPDAVSNDRTGGFELAYRWTNATQDKRLYFTVDRRGTFASGGGLKAAQRETTYSVALSDAEIAQFVELLRATGFERRADEAGDAGELHIVVVRAQGDRHAFEVRGADASLDGLRAWCQSISMRQFRDVIESQPEAGPRLR